MNFIAYPGFVLAYLHMVTLAIWPYVLYTHDCIGHFDLSMVVRYIHYIQD